MSQDKEIGSSCRLAVQTRIDFAIGAAESHVQDLYQDAAALRYIVKFRPRQFTEVETLRLTGFKGNGFHVRFRFISTPIAGRSIGVPVTLLIE